MLTGQNGILNRANEAKKKLQVSNEKEVINMAVVEALTTGRGTVTESNLKATMKSYLGKDVELIGTGPWQYIGTEGAYSINTNGNVAKGWVTINNQNGAPAQVTNGSITLNIGDYINYDPGTERTYTSEVGIDQTTTTSYKTYGPDWEGIEKEYINYKASDYQRLIDADENTETKNKGNGKEKQTYLASDTKNGGIRWQILGTDEKTGELLIVTTDVIKNSDNSTKKFFLKGITGYMHGIDELNSVCNVYGQGKGATGGRSLTYDDINKAIGMKKNIVNSVEKYLWTTESLNKKAPENSNNYLEFSHLIKDSTIGIFNYYDEITKRWKTNEEDLSNIKEKKECASVITNYGGYNINAYNTQLKERYESTKGYEILFKSLKENNIANSQYWLSSTYCINDKYASWGLYIVYLEGYITGYSMYTSTGFVNTLGYGIRPIVNLQSDIKLELNLSLNNTYDIVN